MKCYPNLAIICGLAMFFVPLIVFPTLALYFENDHWLWGLVVVLIFGLAG